jgi:RHS repeat-associated protein
VRSSLTLSQWFEERETAAKRGRPIWNQMLKLLRTGEATGVVIHKIDRSARNLKDWSDLGELIDQGIERNELTKVAPRPNQAAPSTLTETTTYAYDALNRLTQTSYTGVATPTTTYAYDGTAPTGCSPAPPSLTDSYPKGRRTAMCDGSGATSWSHDTMGRVLTETRTIVGTSNVTKSVVYTYNLDGSDSTIQYPGTNKVVTYQPGGAGRPLSAKDVADSINYATGALYAPPGPVTTMVNGGVVTVNNSYNSRVQPVVLSAATTGQTVLSLSYNFHAGNFDNGNIYQIANNRDTTRTQSFTYDNVNRLAQASSSGNKWGEAFTADPWGNMWQRSPVAGKTNYESLDAPANLQNQLTGFTYDVAGNMIQNGSATYTYDGENRLTATAGWTYVYDGDGVRVKKSNGSTGTLYWTGTGSVAISESNLAGTDEEEYVFFGAERVARRDVASNAVHYYFSDHLGSASIVTNAGGTIENESDYYPYGGEMVISATVPQNYKFTGKERDAESGLDDFGARFHASALGRFMTPDWDAKPITVPYAKFGDPQTLNLYSYVENDPVNRADADGHQDGLRNATTAGNPGAPSQAKQNCDANPAACKGQVGAQNKPPAQTPPKPADKNDKTGGGAMVVVSGTATGGVVKTGATATGTAGAGGFYNSKDGVSVGAAASGAETAFSGTHSVGKPDQGSNPSDRNSAGAYVGAGVGVVLTNAGSAQDLTKTTHTFTADLGWGLGGSVGFSGGGGVWELQITIGVGFGGGYSFTQTATTATGGNQQ